jgi:hypothetical protein
MSACYKCWRRVHGSPAAGRCHRRVKCSAGRAREPRCRPLLQAAAAAAAAAAPPLLLMLQLGFYLRRRASRSDSSRVRMSPTRGRQAEGGRHSGWHSGQRCISTLHILAA